MKMYYKSLITGFTLLLISGSCSETFLEKKPYGSISESTLSTAAGVDGLLIGAYSLLDGGGAAGGGTSTGWTALLAPDDARIGPNSGASAYDAFLIDQTQSKFNDRWRFLYSAVQRCNDVLKLLPKAADLTPEDAIQIEAEARFLRAHYYLILVALWKNVPWIDESIDYTAKNYFVPNTEPIYPKIEADFEFAVDNLTETKSQVGRANKWAAKSYLAKTYMFQKKFAEAKPLLDDIIVNGVTSNGLKYALLPNYGDNFRSATKNGSESVFTAQMSVNDGANGLNGNPMDQYNGTFGGPATCCYGWFQPTFDLVNAYQTDATTGLPLLDTYYQTPIPHDQGLNSDDPFTPYVGTLDPRLDHTAGRRGIPYLDWGVHPGKAWVRNQPTSGPYNAIKNSATQANVNSERQGGGGGTSNPLNLIRFADVLLWAAECEVEVGSLAKAEEYVNMVRARAADPQSFVYKYADPNNPTGGYSNEPAANYYVGLYTGQFEANGKSYARKAVRFERRLELAMEHHRFLDMRRYDGNDFDQAVVHNTLMARERAVPDFNAANYHTGVFVKGKHEVFPIPLQQIELMEIDGASVLQQNPNY